MIYHLALQPVGLTVGILLVLTHAFAFVRPQAVARMLPRFPRSRAAGSVLLAAAAVWCVVLLATMDLGEFARLRTVMIIGTIVLAGLSWVFVTEFLAVRAFGILLLLAAEPVLSAAFLQPQDSRLLLVVLAYLWVVAGLFYIGMPYLLRDQISWLTRGAGRMKLAAGAGVAYGLAIVVCALVFY